MTDEITMPEDEMMPGDPRREAIREMLARRYHAIEVTEEMIDAVLAGLDEQG